jgi:acyl-CoA thioester hydrolase
MAEYLANPQAIADNSLDMSSTPPMLHRRRFAGFTQPAPQPYLEETCVVPIRFHEVDSMLVVWHGHYVAYLEEARRALGRRYGVDYPTFFAHSTPAPVAQLRVDYLAPARLLDTLIVTARLFKSEAAKLEFEYEIRRQADGSLLVFATSLQVFTNPQGELLLTLPPFMTERYRAWETLWIQP